jgi:hypothetical protein
MSRTQSVSYAGRSFWAYDVALGVLLKHMIDAANQSDVPKSSTWLSEQVAWWRQVAAIGATCGMDIKEQWSSDQVSCFASVVLSACRMLSERQSIPDAEIVAWPIWKDCHLHTRGAKEVSTAPVVELGEAIVALVNDILPPAPNGTWWYFGLPSGRDTIEMGVSER